MSSTKYDSHIKKLFSKKYTFHNDDKQWNLPNPDDVFVTNHWNVESLHQLKKQLNDVKNKTSEHNLEDWSEHTKLHDPSSNLFQKLRSQFNTELLTQAWIKFFEILTSFNVVNEKCKNFTEFNSVHLCEAPGAFITSLNHYLVINFPMLKYNHLAMSLNPYHNGNSLSEMINDDRLILNDLDNWCFGLDNTGNILLYNNHKELISRVHSKMRKVDLVTADGSVDCMSDPGNQESIVSHLIYCETITALAVLSTDGSYVLKIFTMFESMTINLLYLLNCCFREVHVFKPCSSKGGNSEVYVICLQYYGFEVISSLWSKLLEKYRCQDENLCLFPLNKIPEDFIQQIETCAKMFMSYQIEVIENNLRMFNFSSGCMTADVDDSLLHLKDAVAEFYIEKCKPKYIDSKHHVIPESDYEKHRTTNSFNNLSVQISCSEFPKISDIMYVKSNDRVNVVFNVVIGKKIDKVLSSKFLFHWINDSISERIESFFCGSCRKSKLSKALINGQVRYLDFIHFYDSCDFSKYEICSLLDIIKELMQIKNGDSLCLINFIPLTFFNADVLFILKRNFLFFGCHPDNFILLSNYAPDTSLGLLHLIRVFIIRVEIEQFEEVDLKNYLDKSKSELITFLYNYDHPHDKNFIANTFIEDKKILQEQKFSTGDYFKKSVIYFINPRIIILDDFFPLLRKFNYYILHDNHKSNKGTKRKKYR